MYHFQLVDPHFLPHAGCNIDFSLNEGEITTLIGENGIGKSTLVQRFWQKREYPMTLVEQKLMDVFYDRKLKTIKELILSSRGDRLSESFFYSLWDRFGLKQKEERFQSTLSGGEGQALKLCLGLSQNAEFYLLDEPSQFLDVNMKKVLSDVLSELVQNKKSILMVEHNYDWLQRPATIIELGLVDDTLSKVKTWNT